MMNEGILITLKGTERASNQDFATWHIGQRNEIWMIADGATGAKDSGLFVSTFCEEIIQNLASVSDKILPAVVFDSIETIHSSIRKKFVCSKGSFLLFIVDRETKEQHCFFLGDCRIGTLTEGNIKWSVLPHNMVVAKQITDEHKICTLPERNILFRKLSGRRLERPEYLQLRLDLSLPVILATDGFWSLLPVNLPEEISHSSFHSHLEMKKNRADDLTVLLRVRKGNQ
ncbi:protein phosphatase 2C domain-containing protein [Pantoea sp. MBD-2R]|uniref:protein phosphatase 2C domain-containing protein n=1 Tax=Pantoea sp. MBD-2R TaxID=3141540 RepID=UPI00318351E5